MATRPGVADAIDLDLLDRVCVGKASTQEGDRLREQVLTFQVRYASAVTVISHRALGDSGGNERAWLRRNFLDPGNVVDG